MRKLAGEQGGEALLKKLLKDAQELLPKKRPGGRKAKAKDAGGGDAENKAQEPPSELEERFAWHVNEVAECIASAGEDSLVFNRAIESGLVTPKTIEQVTRFLNSVIKNSARVDQTDKVTLGGKEIDVGGWGAAAREKLAKALNGNIA